MCLFICACLPAFGDRLGPGTVRAMEKAARGISTALLVWEQKWWLGRVEAAEGAAAASSSTTYLPLQEEIQQAYNRAGFKISLGKP